ncbi:hypothetical protein [Actinomyces sp. 565]|uniref:hypothetical protein n=1 Tax=Actinomyces sp. 565 TaxID=2057794 RepID=UPI0013A70A5E|nr:hypothetical protein [Actinomyces sp. 565]NDR54656.1 hypothetical protein [Actinomyces sp. 565]
MFGTIVGAIIGFIGTVWNTRTPRERRVAEAMKQLEEVENLKFPSEESIKLQKDAVEKIRTEARRHIVDDGEFAAVLLLVTTAVIWIFVQCLSLSRLVDDKYSAFVDLAVNLTSGALLGIVIVGGVIVVAAIVRCLRKRLIDWWRSRDTSDKPGGDNES